MSMNHTPNYSLSQWEADDQVLRTEFNEDNAKIDAALARKAEAAGLAALQAALAKKADGTALDALSGTVDSLARTRNCQYDYITYTGNGELSRTLTFPKRPIFLMIFGKDSNQIMVTFGNWPTAVSHSGGNASVINVSRSGNSVTFSYSSHPQYMSNQLGMNYYVFFLTDPTA